jgi:hypothetical protein
MPTPDEAASSTSSLKKVSLVAMDGWLGSPAKMTLALGYLAFAAAAAVVRSIWPSSTMM